MVKNIKIKLNHLAAIYDNENDRFFVGRIEYANDEMILSKNIDKYGAYDGYQLFKKSTITNISYNFKYLKKMKLLEQKNDINYKFENILSCFIFAMKNNRLVTVFLKRRQYLYTIKINKIENNIIYSDIVTLYGEYGKNLIFNIDDIKRIEFDDKDINMIENLLKIEKKY